MIKNHESMTDISYVSVCTDPDREIEIADNHDAALRHYCNCIEIALVVCEVVAAASLALCAFLI